MAVGGQFNKKEYCDLDELSEQFGGREFLIYDLEGIFIGSRISQTDFANEIGACVQTVNNVLKGIKNSTNGFVLFFKDELSEEKLKDKINKIKNRHKDFAVFDKDDKLIGIWNNKVHCSEDLKVSRRNIQRQLNNMSGKEIKIRYPQIYKFYYLENIPNELKNKLIEVI
jgi:hypothetical protein